MFCRTWVVLAIYEPLCCLGKAFFLGKVRTLLLPGVAGYLFIRLVQRVLLFVGYLNLKEKSI